jgi:putative spermidine/putrescine transport system permease protein
MSRALRLGGRLYLALIYLFVAGPAAIIVVDSFNSATSFPSPFESLTLRWYAAILKHDEFLAAIRVSALVAASSAAIATGLALPAAYALVRHRLRGRNAIATLFMGPLLVPQIVMGLAMLQLLNLGGIVLGLGGLIAVHAVYVMPFTLRLAMAGFARFDFALEEAARSLGAGRLRALWHVTLPLIRTSVIAGFTFAFILSFVNLPLSLFLTTPRTATLPIEMFAYMESRIDPLVAAVGALILLAAVAATLTLERVFRLRIAG